MALPRPAATSSPAAPSTAQPTALSADAASLGLRRVAVPTSAGTVVARAGRGTGGPALVLLHGAAGSWTTWTPLLRAADAAGIRFSDVIALDLPGWGDSDDAAAVTSVEEVADAVVETVRALGYASWRLVGHSLGGFVALDIAARHPAATAGVTLVSPTGAGVVDAIRRPVRGGAAIPWFAGMLVAMRTLAALDGAGRGLVRTLGRLGALPFLTSPLFARRLDRSVADAFATEVRPSSFSRAAAYAAAYDERAWAAVVCPVRAVRGLRDVFAGGRDAAAFAAAIPDFRERRLPDAGHFAHIERPDAVWEGLRAAATP